MNGPRVAWCATLGLALALGAPSALARDVVTVARRAPAALALGALALHGAVVRLSDAAQRRAPRP